MATLAELNIIIAANIDQFEAAMKEAERGVGRLGQGLKTMGTGLATAITAPLTLLGAAAVASAAKIDSLRRGLQAVTQQQLGEQGIVGIEGIARAAEDTKKRLLDLREVSALPGLGFSEAIQGDIRLRAVGISAELSKKALLAFGNAIATTGGGKSELDRVTVQLGQLSAKGKVLAQDLRPIIEAAPAVATALKKLYGTVDSETISKSLEKQGKSSSEFIAILTDELGKLPKVTGGLKNALENLSDTTEISLAKFGDSLNKAFNIEGNLAALGDYIARLADRFDQLSPSTQQTIFVLAGVAAVAGPLLIAIGAIGAAIPAITAGFAALSGTASALGVGMAALAGPVGLVVAAIAAAAAGAYYLATANSRAYDSYLEQTAATKQLTTEITPLLNRYEELKAQTTLTSSEQAELRSIIERVTAVLPAAGVGLDNYGNYLDIAAKKARDLISANQGLDKAIALKSLPGQVEKLAALEKQFANLARMRDEFGKTGLFRYSAEDKTAYAPGTKELILFREQVSEVTKALEAQRRVVADLRGALSEPVEEVFGLNGGDIASSLGPVVKLTKEQQDALDKLRKALLDNDNASRALGADYDYLGNRAKILEGGVKNLTDVGFRPGGATVQTYAKELSKLNLTLLDTESLVSRIPKGLAELGDGSTDGFGNKKKFNPLDGSVMTDSKLPTTLQPLDNSAYKKSLQDTIAAAAAFNVEYGAATKIAIGINENFSGQLQTAIQQAAQVIGEGIGAALSGASTGSEALQQVFSGLLGVMADFIVQFGQMLVAQATLTLTASGLASNPVTAPAAIAVGIAAIAVGSALSSFARSGPFNKPSGGAGSSLASSPRSNSYSPSQAPAGGTNAGPAIITHVVELTLDGRTITGALRIEQDRLGRVRGR